MVAEPVTLRVGACPYQRSIGVNGTEHVVVGEEVVKAQVVYRFANPADWQGR
jgi:hypothetical protein